MEKEGHVLSYTRSSKATRVHVALHRVLNLVSNAIWTPAPGPLHHALLQENDRRKDPRTTMII
jgi:hypothetical protein